MTGIACIVVVAAVHPLGRGAAAAAARALRRPPLAVVRWMANMPTFWTSSAASLVKTEVGAGVAAENTIPTGLQVEDRVKQNRLTGRLVGGAVATGPRHTAPEAEETDLLRGGEMTYPRIATCMLEGCRRTSRTTIFVLCLRHMAI